ncbi:hypothetical protein FRB94_013375 [Tulasnella sp. JGI-2019a]|nr:hypothetical protein FRB94_013375 [Tulasnella sp. JGI-2019a]
MRQNGDETRSRNRDWSQLEDPSSTELPSFPLAMVTLDRSQIRRTVIILPVRDLKIFPNEGRKKKWKWVSTGTQLVLVIGGANIDTSGAGDINLITANDYGARSSSLIGNLDYELAPTVPMRKTLPLDAS